MRRLCALALLLALALVFALPTIHAGQDRVAGHWKVTFWDQGELLTFWVLSLEAKDGKLHGKLDVVPEAPQATVDSSNESTEWTTAVTVERIGGVAPRLETPSPQVIGGSCGASVTSHGAHPSTRGCR